MPSSSASSIFTRRKIGVLVACLVVLLAMAYITRRTLLLNAARFYLDRDSALIAQEKADAIAIVFPEPAAAWVTPMKNQMNEIWDPIKANGVNYYMFAKPQTWLNTYSERSNPRSLYYQAWVGGYVIQARDGTTPPSFETLAWQVTALDQRSWLSAMGDPNPLADASPANVAGSIVIDGRKLTLWHGTMRSHSDLSEHPTGPLATLIGMPTVADWPPGVASFHELTLDGYFAGWIDPERKVSVVIYAVASNYMTDSGERRNSGKINDELLAIMRSARADPVR